METVTDFILGGSKIAADSDCSHEIKRCLLLGRKAMTNLDSVFKSRDITFFTNKGPSSQSYDFSSSHIWMWELDHKESWALKNWCFWTVGLEKTLESPLDCKEIKSVHPKGDESWLFIGSSDAKAETPILWPPDEKNWLIGKDPDAGRDWRWEEKGTKGWDGWVASPVWWTRVWASSRSWWWTGKPGVLQSVGSQRVRHDRETELNWTESLEGLMLKLSSNTLATWWEELTHWKRPWGWDRLKAKGERGGRRWDG